MTEKEKMLAGLAYNSRDAELLEMYHHARSLLHQLNHLDSRLTKERSDVLTQLLGKVGEHVWIEAPFFCDYGAHITIGANTFVNVNCVFIDNNEITIGKNGLIGPHVQIYTAAHPLQADQRIHTTGHDTRYLTSSQPVTIGDNVWIGGNTVILPGVTIGHNVTIGAGSVVTKNIPDNVLAFGNPCIVQKQLNPNE
jgi:maltose O-acetyltransferase